MHVRRQNCSVAAQRKLQRRYGRRRQSQRGRHVAVVADADQLAVRAAPGDRVVPVVVVVPEADQHHVANRTK